MARKQTRLTVFVIFGTLAAHHLVVKLCHNLMAMRLALLCPLWTNGLYRTRAFGRGFFVCRRGWGRREAAGPLLAVCPPPRRHLCENPLPGDCR